MNDPSSLPWPRVIALFERCLELPLAGQEALLTEVTEREDVVREVQRLIRHAREPHTLLDEPPQVVQEMRTPPEARLRPGAVLAGRYEVRRWLATGGMGEVYAVWDRDTDSALALKLGKSLPLELRLGRRVTHPAVCRFFDLGQHEDLTFLTMELLEGETLATRLRRSCAWSASSVQAIVGQLLNGVEAIHAAGIVHRDLSPSNVMLLPGRTGLPERTVIVDFGLALAEGAVPTEVRGTFDSLAPEQLRGEPATVRADIYSLGCLLQLLVTHADLPDHWGRVAQEARSADPAQRPASIAQIRQRLATPRRTRTPLPRSHRLHRQSADAFVGGRARRRR